MCVCKPIVNPNLVYRVVYYTHCMWKLRKFTLTEKIFRQITYLVISLVKLLLSRNFCQKCVRVNSRNFHTVKVCTRNTLTLTNRIFRHIITISRNFLKKSSHTFKYFDNFVWKLHETTSTLKSNSPLSIEVCSDKNCSPFSNFQLNSSKQNTQACNTIM